MVTISRTSLSSASHHHRHFSNVISAVLFRLVVDSSHFRSVWILSTRLLSAVKFVLRWSGFFVCFGATRILSAQESLSSSPSSLSASYGLKCHRSTSERPYRSELILDACRGAMRDQALGQKSTGGAAQTADSGQHSLSRPPTAPRPTTPSSCGASQAASVPGAEEFTCRAA